MGNCHDPRKPMRVDDIRSSFFEDVSSFPRGSVTFDSALLMRDIPHEWHSEENYRL